MHMKRDATFLVKVWIVVSVLLMFSALAVKAPGWKELIRQSGSLSLMAAIAVGIAQCRSDGQDKHPGP